MKTSSAQLQDDVIRIARQAGAAIMEVYESDDFGLEHKADESPLTKADKLANEVITDGLRAVSELPIVSEENNTRSAVGGEFWLVDPLDGTKEFVKRNGEFTVNIALIKDGTPVLGVVYAPVIDRLYFGNVETHEAFREENGTREVIESHAEANIPVIVTSKSHKDERTERLLASIGVYEEQTMGSSLKLCLVAEGAAMLYPRLAPTYLWDTGAADAVVRASGGLVTNTEGESLVYQLDKESLLNPYFVVASKNCTIEWKSLLA